MATQAPTTPAADLDALWQPLQVGPVTLPNRIVFSAHSTNFPSDRGLVDDRYIAYVRARTQGGCGLVTTSATAVHPTGYRMGEFRAFDDTIVPGWRRLADAVHESDAKLFTQLYHCGQQTTGQMFLDTTHAPIGASALASPIFGRKSAAVTQAEIAELVDAWAAAAERAREAGLDGVEIGGAHGYLIAEFLSPLTNRREDEYGGSVENRTRFALEIATEIRRRVGSDLAVGLRFSFDEYIGAAGIEPDDADRQLAIFRDSGLFDYLFVSGSNYSTLHQLLASRMSGRDRHMVPNARRAQTATPDRLPIMVSSSVHSVEAAAEIVGSGDADLVAMVRAQIADPELVEKARSGAPRWRDRCVGFNQGCVSRVFQFQMLACTVNPAAGREGTLGAVPAASVARRIVIVGGGPAGLQAAETAAERGHDVVLLERADALGGQLRYASRLPGRASWSELVDDLAASVARLGVDVRTGTDATAEAIEALTPDAVLVATGASFDDSGHSIMLPFRDAIAGADQDHVLGPLAVLDDLSLCGDRVVIVDDSGEMLPLGLASLLADTGRQVTVVTAQLSAGAKLAATMELPWIMPQLHAAGVDLIAQSLVTHIEPAAVGVSSVWGGEPATIAADTVILTLERTQEDALLHELRARGVDAQAVGDCRSPRDVDAAIHEAAAAASAL
jgi:2,4-dienoyl-CoA reductase-like NADH-dependent reductase (Old Yellow Enzyme family)